MDRVYLDEQDVAERDQRTLQESDQGDDAVAAEVGLGGREGSAVRQRVLWDVVADRDGDQQRSHPQSQHRVEGRHRGAEALDGEHRHAVEIHGSGQRGGECLCVGADQVVEVAEIAGIHGRGQRRCEFVEPSGGIGERTRHRGGRRLRSCERTEQ